MTLDADLRSAARPAELSARATGLPAVVPAGPSLPAPHALPRAGARLRMLGRLTGGVAHDVNNLLTVVLANLDLLRQAEPSSSPGSRQVEDAACAARRAGELCRGLLALVRRDPPRLHVVDVNAVLEETVRLLRRLLDPRIVVEVRATYGPCAALADPARLSEVLMNLALNARDAMPEGGRLTLSTSLLPPAPGAAAGDLGRVRVAVRDSGAGLTPEARAHLFDPGYTTKPAGHGHGLGLCTVASIVRGLGGTLDWTSERGRGTQFVVLLPRVAAAPEPCAERADAQVGVGAGAGERVLVVDDEDMLREVTQAWLVRDGYRVRCAADGEEALRLLVELPFDLVLLDLSMPRLSGPGVLAWLRAHAPRVPVLLMSGSGHAAAEDEHPPGTAGFLAKPFDLTLLSGAVRRALDAPRPGDAA